MIVQNVPVLIHVVKFQHRENLIGKKRLQEIYLWKINHKMFLMLQVDSEKNIWCFENFLFLLKKQTIKLFVILNVKNTLIFYEEIFFENTYLL